MENGVRNVHFTALELFSLETVDFKKKLRTFTTPKISKNVLRLGPIYLYPQKQPALKTPPMSLYADSAILRFPNAPSGKYAGGGFSVFVPVFQYNDPKLSTTAPMAAICRVHAFPQHITHPNGTAAHMRSKWLSCSSSYAEITKS